MLLRHLVLSTCKSGLGRPSEAYKWSLTWILHPHAALWYALTENWLWLLTRILERCSTWSAKRTWLTKCPLPRQRLTESWLTKRRLAEGTCRGTIGCWEGRARAGL